MRHNAVEVDGVVRHDAEPKTDRSARRVKIGAATVRVLRDHLAVQRENRLTMGAGWHDEGLVFPAVDGQVRRPVALTKTFAGLVRTTGMRPVTLHALRHAHGTLLLDQGLPVHQVAARLGHDPAMLLRVYSHAHDRSQDAAAALDGLLDGVAPTLRVVDPPAPETADEEADRAVL